MFIPRVLCKCVRWKGRLENPMNLRSSLSSYKERLRPFSVTRARYPLFSHTLGRLLVAVTNALLRTTQTWKAYVGLELRGCSPPWSERHRKPEQEAAGHVASTTRKHRADQKRPGLWTLRALGGWAPSPVRSHFLEVPWPSKTAPPAGHQVFKHRRWWMACIFKPQNDWKFQTRKTGSAYAYDWQLS